MTTVLFPEWAPQAGVMLVWPDTASDWAPTLAAVEPVYTRLATVITHFAQALIIGQDEAHLRAIQRQLAPHTRPDRLAFAAHATDDTWIRDYGPLTVQREGRTVLLDFRFNGWGGKYPALQDDTLTQRLHAAGVFGEAELEVVPLVLEGGAIDTDGAGTLLATRRCVLAPSRNPGLDEAELEASLKALLGARRILWLAHGWLAGDDTDGHVDMLARFCAPDTIAYTRCDDSQDEHATALGALALELKTLRQADGAPYRLIPLPLPAPIYDPDGRRLPASYANFLIVNEAVLVPTYHDPADTIALKRLQAVFTPRRAIGIDCRALIAQYGSLHCATLQLPQGVPIHDAHGLDPAAKR